MDHQDHVRLIRDGITPPGGIWAEFGSGRGAFTLALAELVGPEGTIYSVDKNVGALRDQAREIEKKFPHRQPVMHYLHKDFRQQLTMPSLHGVVMANSLHFYQDKASILRTIEGYLVPGGRLILVEYNSDQGNSWVPHPISFRTWKSLAKKAGFERTRLMKRVSSSFMGEIFSAISYKIEDASS